MKFIVALVCSVVGFVVLLIVLVIGSLVKSSYELDSMLRDFERYRDVFERAAEAVPTDKPVKYIYGDYVPDSEDIDFVLNELKFKMIYSDFKGNVFFDKNGFLADFDGLVYLVDDRYVVGVPKTTTRPISGTDKWIVYYAHGL